MSKKKKKNISPSRSAASGFFAKIHRFDWTVLMVAGIILLNALAALGHSYHLDKPDPYGFPVWFLLLIGHLPMEIIEFSAKVAGVEGETIENFIRHREALLLGICDLTVLAAVWAIMRFVIFKRFGAEPLRIAIIFLRLIFFWGIFQLCCFIAVKNWSDGKVNPLHRDLKKSEAKAFQEQ